MIAIIDYDAGNIGSVEKALDFLGEKTIVTEDPVKILNADGVILPGVGAFGGAMARLRARGLEEVIRKCVEREIPFLGICRGQHLLFESSEESPGVKGLHILDGKVMRIPAQEGVKVPHMGWNDLQFPRQGRLFEGLADHTSVYFVHSYYLRAGEEQVVTARAEYGLMIDASVEKGNVFGCQFHPEKSADAGLQILRNFIRVTKG